MRKVFTIVCLLLTLGICACTAQEKTPEILFGTYVYKESKEWYLPHVILEEDGTFSFFYSGMTSYFPKGTFTAEGDRLILVIDQEPKDITGQYVFRIEENKLIFLKEESKPLPEFAEDSIKDGAEFLYEGKMD